MDEPLTTTSVITIGPSDAPDERRGDALSAALHVVLDNARAAAVLHVRAAGPGSALARSAGWELAWNGEAPLPLGDLPIPPGWSARGVTRIASHVLPDDAGVLVIAWAGPPAPDSALLGRVLTLVDSAVAHAAAVERLADLTARVDNAQQLANMGDYDWHIATDTNRWSDQLYRIYGHEPQSFNATYERFLAHVHPDDRERITEIHQRAYASGEPYEMVERIVRPDGSVRYLASNGQVIQDGTGTPVRMRGTCIDITDRVLAEQERERVATRLHDVTARRQQALEMNDNVVQALSAAVYSLDAGNSQTAFYLDRALAGARHLMNDWLQPPDGTDIAAGDLVRVAGSTLRTTAAPPSTPAEPPAPPAPRIVIVDDNDDVRRLVRVQIERLKKYDIVGEAEDGLDAIEVVRDTQPDVVFLDLAMPRMDGLEALPLIRQAAPATRVVVLSGFDEGTIAGKALAAGAVRYVEKGVRIDFAALIDGVMQAV